MSASAPFFTSSWRAGKYRCELSVPPLKPGKATSCLIEWSPAMPTKPLSASARRQYRRGRDAAFAELSAKVGGAVVGLEL